MKLRYYLGPVCPAGACERPYGHGGTNGYAGHSEDGAPDSLGTIAHERGCVVCGSNEKLCIVFTGTVYARCRNCDNEPISKRMEEIQKHAALLWAAMFNTRSLDVYGERFQKLLDGEELS